LPHLILAF